MVPGETIEHRQRPLLVRGELLGHTLSKPANGRSPSWSVTLEEAAARVAAQARDAIEELRTRDPRYLGDSPILEIKLHDFALASTHYPTSLFKACGLVPVESYVAHQKVRSIFVAGSISALQHLVRITRDALSGKASATMQNNIRAVDSLCIASARVRKQTTRELPDDDLIEVILHGQISANRCAAPASKDTIRSVQRLISDTGGRLEDEWISTSGTMTFLPARIGSESIAVLQNHNAVMAIQTLARLRDLPVGAHAPLIPFPVPTTPAPMSEMPPLRVAVFDGGVADASPVWQGKVVEKVLGELLHNVAARQHGELVTSAMIYGHLDSMTLPSPANIHVTHYAAVPQASCDPDLQMYWLLDAMKKAIVAENFEVVLVCVGPDLIVADDYVDRWTSTIDQLAFEQDILFVIAAGNNGKLSSGLNRILVPADTANGIAIGASETRQKIRRAPDSPVGPGRSEYQIRPSGVAYGGSSGDPFIAVDSTGQALAFHGTSCAAALVVHGLARAAAQLGIEHRSARTLRCCAIHFARPAREKQANEEGYGYLPHEYPYIADTAPNTVHVLYEGETGRKDIAVLPIPLPKGVSAPLKMRITLVSSSNVNSSEAGDYVNAGLNTKLRPDARRYDFRLAGEKTERVSLTNRRLCKDLIDAGYRRSPRPAAENWTFRNKREDTLRGEGKWESVQVIAHDFKKTPFEPVIDLEHLSRQSGALTSSSPPLKWSMLVTLECAEGINLYDAVTAQFWQLQPLIVMEPGAAPDIEN